MRHGFRRHAAAAPISLERAEEINEQATSSTSFSTTTSTTAPSTTTTMTSTTTPITEKITVSLEISTEEETTTTRTFTTEAATRAELTTETLPDIDEKNESTTTASVKVVDVEANLRYTEQDDIIANTTTRATPRNATLQTKSPQFEKELSEAKESDEDLTIVRQQLSAELEESVKHLEKALEEVEHQKAGWVDYEVIAKN
ncbi:hypothetical protein ANCCAN_25426 [Ancylostoma caninum]|uniref:Uncharacterized protein n=1 Tax=Ancylostoma caninum TaxID=29170 RepID=A0A368F9N5_ANCCA|nr:hypothetical protein ANCCAN_25426 [Ancylostoma caninum]